MNFLTKSDFQLASTCPKKLMHQKASYPSNLDLNEYLEMLSKGGYIIGEMAKFYYPEGIEIKGSTDECISETIELLKHENVTLFEPAIVHEQKLVRIDILQKRGNHFHIIEVKSSSFDSTDIRVKTKLKKHFQDIAFQYYTLKQAYPESTISASLFMPDKARKTEIDGLASWFYIENGNFNSSNNGSSVSGKKRFNKPHVVFKFGNHPDKSKFIEELVGNGILSFLDVTKEVEKLQSQIEMSSDFFIRILKDGITSKDYQINKTCSACEFKTPHESKDGFAECWGDLGYKEHHIFDLYNGGSIGSSINGYYFDELINQGKTSLFDIDYKRLSNSNGKYGTRGTRQIIQIENTKLNKEWKSEALKDGFSFEYPLHFIDFETYTGAIPFHKGMRPYELIAFQWSCHSIPYEGAAPIHKEWIHTGTEFPDSSKFPNFEFAQSLMKHIGNNGTPFMWATHENTVLKTILNQMPEFGIIDAELESWLTDITSNNESDGRWVDMNKMTLEHYFHPYMKGKTSIKKVLPAIWSHFPYLHEVPHFKDYKPESLSENILDLYDTLTSGIDFTHLDEDAVNDGTAAMRAYYRIMFDDALSELDKNEIRRQLLEYCKLDTMAMVIIAYHWGIR